ncbi:MIF4G domain-containing protein B-like [Dermacentor silvarum]|uniref:MIF4G domain-containing protein B-like n=1 Tax=Dermacentor silvarum TaxID=543639 RepID=UPI001897388F|nr:MIF4G domain-containing protein B-like [Dermacentor silvarum]
MAYVTFLAELLAAVSEIKSSDENCGRIFCLAALLCDCCLIMLHSPAQDTSAEMQCLRVVFMTAGKSIQRAAPYLSKSLATCLRNSFMDSNRSAGVRQALLELIEFRASGWKLGAAQQLYYSAHDSGAAVTD